MVLMSCKLILPLTTRTVFAAKDANAVAAAVVVPPLPLCFPQPHEGGYYDDEVDREWFVPTQMTDGYEAYGPSSRSIRSVRRPAGPIPLLTRHSF